MIDADGNTAFARTVNDYRNSLKIFTDKYSPSIRKMSSTRDVHDAYFRDMIHFQILKIFDLNDDLGIFFDANKEIVFNTQLANVSDPLFRHDKSYLVSFGKQMGQFIGEVYQSSVHITGPGKSVPIKEWISAKYYIDVNTSRETHIFEPRVPIELSIYLFHMYTWTGYVRNVLQKELPEDNSWLIRMKFVAVYNIERGFVNVVNYYNGRETPQIIKQIKALLPSLHVQELSLLRNAMMHYGLQDKSGRELLNDSNALPDRPLYGLIEACSGVNSFDVIHLLQKEIEELYCFLGQNFHFSEKRFMKQW
ncbi:hypothetical protein [Lactimicrobium massiliense]|uniref:hypothetical protein n=1 Tax=Lactimicrobium massiliense TaxID=2161814 RepID=UPI000D54C743|nr:hypothetical protein [Lactimicrobium massiliense]